MASFFISWLVLLATCLTFVHSQDRRLFGYGNWGSWSPCKPRYPPCGDGTQVRSRCFWYFRRCYRVTQSKRCSVPCGCQAGQTVYDRCGQRCVCGAGGTLTKCTRIRKEFTSMTTAERQRYIRVIKTASTHSKYKSRYNALITLHKNLFNGNGIHERRHFLTWHRWYIVAYENLLREVNCRFTVSYWDWSVVSGNPWGTTASDVWYSGNSGMGGNGAPPNQCVRTGPFRNGIWELVPSAAPPRCLKRDFFGNPPDSVAVTQVIDLPASRFTDFERTLRVNLHNTVHCLIGATMCSGDSASAPEFFLHHGMIDKRLRRYVNMDEPKTKNRTLKRLTRDLMLDELQKKFISKRMTRGLKRENITTKLKRSIYRPPLNIPNNIFIEDGIPSAITSFSHDQIWTDWQKKSNSHKTAFFPSVNGALPGTGGLRPNQFLDNAALPGGIRVEYAEIGEGPVARTVRRLRVLKPTTLKKIPRERFSGIRKDANKLFKVSAEEEAEAKKMEKQLQPKVAIQPPKASAVDRNLGFDHKAVESMK